MKAFAKQAIRDEQGQAMILALILLLVSGLMIAPLLSFMGTGLRTGEVYETKTDELYAADAGVEQAVRRLAANHSANFTIPNINNKSVAVNTTIVGNTTQRSGCNVTRILTYRIESIATGDGSSTEIVAYVNATSVSLNYSGLLDYVLATPGGIYCPNPPNPCPCTRLNDLVSPGCGAPNGPNSTYSDPWPTAGDLAEFYRQDVRNALPYYTGSTLDANDYKAGVGPLYWDRTETVKIENTGDKGLELRLNGTVYIRGDTVIKPNKDMTLNLSRRTLFVESNTMGGKYALEIGGDCSVQGPGVIIAVGNIYFAPKSQIGGPDGPIFILSVNGKTELQPNGDFYGSVAGLVEIDLKSNNKVVYPSMGYERYGLNFPRGQSNNSTTFSVVSWEVNPR